MTIADIVDRRKETLASAPITAEHDDKDKLYILDIANRVDDLTGEKYKILLYRSTTPTGKTKTALLKLGLSKFNETTQKHIKYNPSMNFLFLPYSLWFNSVLFLYSDHLVFRD